jgi:hypothetical protein
MGLLLAQDQGVSGEGTTRAGHGNGRGEKKKEVK